ncbi:putative membrane protein [Clostridium bornimense]|uniref:Putative membrane protein n=1 Tax=Clostridium bornimense TaxID=1216932 RepID=W6RSX5_9CLOT|nr:O-antigen ligase family protein [Clostridium bornimense]CDM67716.1 putative membrane protein [Clostridium bornimense]
MRINLKLEEEFTKEKLVNTLIYLLLWMLPFFIVTKESGKGIEFGKGIFLIVISIISLTIIVKEKKIKMDLISKIALIYLALVSISTVFSMDIKQSIVGAHGRYEGLIMISVYVVLFFAAKNYFSIDKKALNMTLALVTILAILSLIQFYGFDPIWGQKSYFGKELTEGIKKGLSDEILFPKYLATIGNRNFVSTYFSIFLPVTIGGYIFYKNKYCFIASLFIYGALLCTLTRSGYVGFIFAGIILLTLLIKEKNKEHFKRLAMLALAFIMIFGFINFTSKGAVANRLGLLGKDVTSFSEKSGSSRIGIWKLVIKVIEEKPILGTGPDTIDKALPAICGDDYKELGFIVDKAHNEFLQIAATMGIPTLIIYLIFLLLILKNIIKNIRQDQYKILLLVFVAFITQSFFNISIISVASVVWIFFGVMSKEKFC